MKRTKILFSLYILCCALISCDGRGNNLKEPTQMEFEQLKAEAIELATYLTDNYTVGDSIFFKTETGETEGFIVENRTLDNDSISLQEPYASLSLPK